MNVLLHIPHDSLAVPKYFYKDLRIKKEEFRKYNLRMSDLGVSYLTKDIKGKRIKAKYSRLFCDVERFRDDEMEVMSKYGEGVVYTHTYDGKLFHSHSPKYRRRVLKYYDSYHNKLNRITKRLLRKDNKLLILDIHSFSDLMADSFFSGDYPDICIGVEENYYDEDILKYIISRIEKLGLSYKINYPYKGSLVPNCVFNNEVKGEIVSIMLEINKRIYL